MHQVALVLWANNLLKFLHDHCYQCPHVAIRNFDRFSSFFLEIVHFSSSIPESYFKLPSFPRVDNTKFKNREYQPTTLLAPSAAGGG